MSNRLAFFFLFGTDPVNHLGGEEFDHHFPAAHRFPDSVYEINQYAPWGPASTIHCVLAAAETTGAQRSSSMQQETKNQLDFHGTSWRGGRERVQFFM